MRTQVASEATYWIEHEPGDGYRYLVCVSPLPDGPWGLGGSNDTHALVTLFYPGNAPRGTAYVLAREGYLDESYLVEKFSLGGNEVVRSGAIGAIRAALGRD